MLKKILVIVNPNSGRGMSKLKIGDIVTRFARHGYLTAVLYTLPDGTAELVRRFAGGYDCVVCVGGDGTLSDVVNGAVTLENPPPIGYIPSGTANDIASTLALPRDIGAAVEVILKGETADLDVGRFGDNYFTYIAAFGAFTNISYATPQNAKRALGHFAYVLNGIADAASLKQRVTSVEYDGGTFTDEFIFGSVTNSTSVAGFLKIAPDIVDLSDGLFEVVLVKRPMNFVQLREILRGLANGVFESEYAQILHTSRVKFTFEEPVAWTRDGENGGEWQEILIENKKRAVQVIIPCRNTGTEGVCE